MSMLVVVVVGAAAGERRHLTAYSIDQGLPVFPPGQLNT